MKILYITTIGVTMRFFESFIKEQVAIGNQIDIATNENNGKTPVSACYREWGCSIYHLDTSRSPVSFGNIRAIKQIRELVKLNHYDIVHCHTPIAAMATRLACRKFRIQGLKVFYTAHGFHFYSGAPLKNWLLYYTVEWLCSWFTDLIITINKEDYCLAKHSFHAKYVKYVPGVGINLNKFQKDNEVRISKRNELGFKQTDIVILSVGELSERKNHIVVIKALSKIKKDNIHYIICGDGSKKELLLSLAKEYDIAENVHILGYRKDVDEFYKMSDLFVFPSRQEGLPVALMEAIACKLPVIASNIRGNNDLVFMDDYLFEYNSVDELLQCIKEAIRDLNTLQDKQHQIYENLKKFSLSNVNKIMKDIYGRSLDNE